MEVENTLKIVNKVIDYKKLHFNHIWANKITQEDYLTMKSLEDVNNNNKLLENLMNSILRFTDKINDLFCLIINTKSDDNSNKNLELFFSLSKNLENQFKNFVNARTKYYKIPLERIKKLIKCQENIKNCLEGVSENDRSQCLEKFLQFLEEFNKILLENHISK